MGATSACLTDPPPDLPLVEQPPAIDHSSVYPPEGIPLTSLPAEFELWVSLADPTQACQWSVYDGDSNEPILTPSCTPCSSGTIKDGKILITFDVSGARFNPTLCHHIVFTVFGDPQCRSGGSDAASWYFQPQNASCVSYDAASLGDGAFPEAGADALPVVPDSGGD